ncbi:hypothetical protein ACFV42_48145 [Streptomyces solisilvae]|uniref:hypothetical protein n=1 Tax=Streptomyces malaysiensis TaxID=92644 RepID=UPI0036AB5B0D
MADQLIDFLPDSINNNLAAATLLTDEIVPMTLRLVFEHTERLAISGNTFKDACMGGAALIYQRAIGTLRALKGTQNGPDYGEHTQILLMRIAVADSLTHRAGHPFRIADALGHLAYPLGDEAGLREAVARNADLRDRQLNRCAAQPAVCTE